MKPIERKLNFKIALLLSLLLLIALLPRNVSAAQPVATISLYEAEKSAAVEPGALGMVNFTGIVEASMIGPGQNLQSVTVHLGVDAGDWDASVSPSSFDFSQGEGSAGKAFSVTVAVPLGIPAGTEREVVVSGTATAQPGGQTSDATPATGSIVAAPYYIMNFSCSEPEKKGKPGDTLHYDLLLKNEGNAPTYYSLGTEKEHLFTEIYGSISYTRKTVELGDHREKLMGLTIKLYPDAPPGTYQLNIWSVPHGENSSYAGEAKVVNITVEVEEAELWEKVSWYWYVLGSLVLVSVVLGVVFLIMRRSDRGTSGSEGPEDTPDRTI